MNVDSKAARMLGACEGDVDAAIAVADICIAALASDVPLEAARLEYRQARRELVALRAGRAPR